MKLVPDGDIATVIQAALPDGPIGTWQSVIWQLIETRATRTGAMIHLATEEVDRGPVLSHCVVPIVGGAFDADWRALTGRLGIADADEMIAAPQVKEGLRRGTEEAAERGIFGIPTFVIGDEIFWGLDTTDLVLDYLNDPALFAAGEYARISDLPIAQARRL